MEETNPSPQPASAGGNKNMLLIGLFVLIVIAVIGGVFVMGKSNTAQKTQNEQAAQTSPTPEGAMIEVTQEPSSTGDAMSPSGAMEEKAMTSGETKTFTVEASSYKFVPSSITVKKGDTVKIVLTDKGGFHDFILDDFNARTKTLQTGQTDTIEFVADKTGTFEYYCSVGNHRQLGMVGKLIVQ